MKLQEIYQNIANGGFWVQAAFFLILYSSLLLSGSFLRKRINAVIVKRRPKDEFGNPKNVLMLYCVIKQKVFPLEKKQTSIEATIRNTNEMTIVIDCPCCRQNHFFKLRVRYTGLPQKYKRGAQINNLSVPDWEKTLPKSEQFLRQYEAGRLKGD